jgi:uncharacterized protein DUF87
LPKRRRRLSKLVLGWHVNDKLEPIYWLDPKARPGGQKAKHLVQVPAESISNHTIIVAQSGSGKSFFVGRLIEEILLKTKGRVLVLDPNSDFRKITVPVSPDRWKTAKYNQTTGSGYLPHERSLEAFAGPWNRRKKRVYSARRSRETNLIELDWLSFSIDWFANDADLTFPTELRHCHRFVQAVYDIARRTMPLEWRMQNRVLSVAQRLCEAAPHTDRLKTVEALQAEFGKGRRLKPKLEEAAKYRSFVKKEAENFYFSIAQEAMDSKILATVPRDGKQEPPVRAHVVDLPSIEKLLFRRMAVRNFVNDEWTRGREEWERALKKKPDSDSRAPVFIVIDEAHNLLPGVASERALVRLQEQFRTVAAEGRKFGIFLILITQRPDKLDSLVVSECENKAIMKVGSEVVLDAAGKLIGLSPDEAKTAKACLDFSRGRVLLYGPWVEHEPTIMYTAMRRTEEGGRGLRDDYWAVR